MEERGGRKRGEIRVGERVRQGGRKEEKEKGRGSNKGQEKRERK